MYCRLQKCLLAVLLGDEPLAFLLPLLLVILMIEITCIIVGALLADELVFSIIFGLNN